MTLGLRGNATAWRVLKQSDSQLMSQALQDIRYAEYFSGETPFILHAKTIALRIADEFDRIEGKDRLSLSASKPATDGRFKIGQ